MLDETGGWKYDDCDDQNPRLCSDGLFGVPVTVCCEAIVTAVKIFGSQGGRSLRRIILIDNRGEVVRAMQEACDRFLQGISPGNSTPSDLGFQMGAAAQHTARGAPAGGSVHIEVIQGTIETQQVDVLVSPMAGHSPCSTRIGNILSNVVGSELTAKFEKEAAGGVTLPGDIVLVEGLAGLQSKAVIFLNLARWHNSQHDNAVQVLRQGIRKILASCSIKRYSSVALSVLGTGAVLKFPHSLASRVILEEVKVFDQDRASASPFLIRIIIHPNDRESSMAFQSAQDTLHLRGFTNDANPDQASFYRHVSATNDEITAMLGGVRLQMVLGDITNEGTDVIVNTTDFSNNPAGVSKAILTAAGPAVQAELAQVGIPLDPMCTTGAGFLGCRKIIHASFMGDPQVSRKNCKKILKKCERERYCSVAFPAINTGAGGMDSVEACKAMLDGMVSAVRDLKPKFLSLIRIVILQQPIFQAFRSELENRFGQIAPPRLNLKEKAKQILKKWIGKQSRTSTSSAPEEYPLTSSKPQPAIMSVICRRSDTMTIKRDLESILQNQLEEREVDVCDLSRLNDMELEAVKANIRVLGISVERRRHLPSESVSSNRARSTAGAEAKAHSGSGKDVYVLKGLKEDVLSIIELVNRAVNKALCEDLQDKNEAMLALGIQWSIQDIKGVWNELSLHDNYILEDTYINKLVFVDLKAPDGMNVKVNLKEQQATDLITGITYKVKRIETGTALELPPHWEPMHNEVFKKVEIQPNSPEYQTVAQGFHRTARNNIQKIERVQNLYLWYAYTVCRERILAKNGLAELGEMSLYHGTSAESCKCIERDKFDRRFAGAHAAMYGMGVYFAVNAEYSANGYSPPDASGLKRFYQYSYCVSCLSLP
uniref:poly [ADP-ribose] polymerase 14-like n=1 Tax=Monopterus albus TaxID=43700 RepID=UPI0009B45F82|nr:poly [ADP-ribose] polymerase 14-like [Monopterus albus]